MKKQLKTLTILFLVTLTIGTVTAQTTDFVDELNLDSADNEKPDTYQGSSATQLPLNFLLDFLQTEKKIYSPGETADISYEITPTKTGTHSLIFEANRCDSTVTLSNLDRNDCNNNIIGYEAQEINVAFKSTVYAELQQQMPQEEANYELVVYLYNHDFRTDGKDNDDDGEIDEADEAVVSASAPNKFVQVSADSGEDDSGTLDSDGDGIVNSNDNCPFEKGPEENNGCPYKDSDGDGVLDQNDACPNTAGSGSDGCPVETSEDSDGDGVIDSNDECPEKPGPKSNNGCPTGPSQTLIVGGLLVALLAAVGGVLFLS